jgi:hypothetical protein
MTQLEKLHGMILQEDARVEMLKNTKDLDVDFMREEIKQSKERKADLQMLFDREYDRQNN